MKLDKVKLANAFAMTTVVSWVICSLFVMILPELSLQITKWWLHGIDVAVLGEFQLNLSNFLLGGVSLAASFWIVGYILGWSLEYLEKK